MQTTLNPIEPSSSSAPAAAEAFLIDRKNAFQVYPGRVAKMIEEAYKFADENVPPDMIEQLSRGYRQLWIVWDGSQVLAAVTTRIIQQRSCRACQITAAGGGALEHWKDLISLIEDFAQREGCRKVIIEGRPGWERLYRDYKRVRVVIEKELPWVAVTPKP